MTDAPITFPQNITKTDNSPSVERTTKRASALDEQRLIEGINMSETTLTIIITLRATKHYDMVPRLRNRLLDTRIPESVQFLVVDDGSEPREAAEIKSTCEELGFTYIRHDSGKLNFCASSARNTGAKTARSIFIMHEDVDLFPYPGFYQDLVDEIYIQELDKYSNRFITVPCLYLSEDATDRMLSGDIQKNSILHAYLVATSEVATALPASSVILLNRHYYLACGGYNENFNGWGLEDLEYAHRLTASAKTFLTPQNPDYLVEGGYATFSAYKGWRSQFRLHGDLLSRKGIVIFHAYHPKDTAWRNSKNHGKNKTLFDAEIKKFSKEGHTLPALEAPENGKSLIFGRGTFAYNRSLMPLWGEIEVKSYEYFDEIDIVEYCKVNKINRVIFTNPYASEKRIKVYNIVRSAGISFVVVERGALPDSMFIDDTGFCCESTRYNRKHWPQVLDKERLNRANEYILNQFSSSSALEKQGAKIGKRAALAQLGIPPSKKVLFIPFQSRSDTTVTYFGGAIGSFDNFVNLVKDVTKKLSPEWVVIFKKHPLSSVKENIPGAVDIGEMHINDALELASYVLLMNSGVGVLSVLFGKPVIHTAQAFYSDYELNRSASTAAEVIEHLKSDFKVDADARMRFVSYLIEDFYSFGKFTTSTRKHTDNALLTITEKIQYYRVNFLGKRILDLQEGMTVKNYKAPVYDIFREWIILNNFHKKTPNVVPKSSSREFGKTPDSSRPAVRKRFLELALRKMVKIMGNRADDVDKFDADPLKFFTKLRNPIYKKIGVALLSRR